MPTAVRVEHVAVDARLREPYRGVVTQCPMLRLIVQIAAPGRRAAGAEVTVEVDDASVEVCDARGCFAVREIDQLFVVERQPPAWRFLPWFGVFARRHGRPDRLLLETPEGKVARFVERAIEDRLGLSDEPVRGELRV